jgi:hypothetical protein
MKCGVLLTILAVCFISTLGSQPSTTQLFQKNLNFFEYLLESTATTAGADQKAFLTTIHLSAANGAVLVQISSAFKQQEEMLAQQANAVLARQDNSEISTVLPQIRAQRAALLQQQSLNLMQQLDADGLSRLQALIAKYQQVRSQRP